MTSARRIRELADALTATNGESAERPDCLDLRGRLDRAQVVGWAEVLATLPIAGIESVTAIDAVGDPVCLGAADGDHVDQDLRIQVRKARSPTTVFCITEDGVSAVFADHGAIAAVRQVWVAGDFAPFKTESCQVAPWEADATLIPTTVEETRAPDPRRLVKDFVGNRVPKSVFPYLLASEAPTTSEVFERWRDLSVVRMLNSLVNEVQSTDLEQVVITGTRPRKIKYDLKPPYSEALFAAATAATRWIYASGRDVDTRFALFTYELSREWPDTLSLKEGFEAKGESALEAASTAFRAHVQETSKDMLKSLGDLRKTLSEEVTKVVAQTRELMTTMWRDFMVAATSFLGRVVLLGSDKPLSNPWPLEFLLIGTALFLCFSLILSLKTNAKFMAISDASRVEWRKKLYGFMSVDDFQKLSDEPINQAVREYKQVARRIVIAYATVVLCLLWTAWGAKGTASHVDGVGGAQAQHRSSDTVSGGSSTSPPPVPAASSPPSGPDSKNVPIKKAGQQVGTQPSKPPATTASDTGRR